MDGFDASQAPLEYQQREWLVNISFVVAGIGWLTNYAGMIHKSFQQQTYSLPLWVLSFDFAWEIMQVILYPPQSRVEHAVVGCVLILNLGVMYSAQLFAAKEFVRSPFVARHIRAILLLMTLAWLAAQLALVAQLGFVLGTAWTALLAQPMISVGALAQLLLRGGTRGASYTLWLSRFLGTSSAAGFVYLRWKFWPQQYGWLNCPWVWWMVTVWFVADVAYGVFLWYIKRFEREMLRVDMRKKMF